MKIPRRSEKKKRLTTELEGRLIGYGAAAGALLMAAPPALADVVLFAPGEGNSTNGSIYFDLLSGTTNRSAFSGAQFRIASAVRSDLHRNRAVGTVAAASDRRN